MTTNAERHRLTRRMVKKMRELHPDLGEELLSSLSRLAANVAADWTDQRGKQTDSPDSAAQSSEDPPPPAVILQMEQALLDHFPDMPQFAARILSGDVFEQVQEFHEWKVHPFPNHLLPRSLRRGPAPPWPGDPASSRRLGFRLVRIDP